MLPAQTLVSYDIEKVKASSREALQGYMRGMCSFLILMANNHLSAERKQLHKMHLFIKQLTCP